MTHTKHWAGHVAASSPCSLAKEDMTPTFSKLECPAFDWLGEAENIAQDLKTDQFTILYYLYLMYWRI